VNVKVRISSIIILAHRPHVTVNVIRPCPHIFKILFQASRASRDVKRLSVLLRRIHPSSAKRGWGHHSHETSFFPEPFIPGIRRDPWLSRNALISNMVRQSIAASVGISISFISAILPAILDDLSGYSQSSRAFAGYRCSVESGANRCQGDVGPRLACNVFPLRHAKRLELRKRSRRAPGFEIANAPLAKSKPKKGSTLLLLARAQTQPRSTKMYFDRNAFFRTGIQVVVKTGTSVIYYITA